MKGILYLVTLLKNGLRVFYSILRDWAINPFFWVLLIDTLLYSVHWLFAGKYSNALMFQSPSAQGDLQYWALDMSFLIRVSFTPMVLVIGYFTKYRLTKKGLLQIVIYWLLSIKDILDYMSNGEQGTITEDLIVLFGALFSLEILSRIFDIDKVNGKNATP